MIFHRRLVVHAEVHRGYKPRISIRWEPQIGDETDDGILIRCHECSGQGLLAWNPKYKRGGYLGQADSLFPSHGPKDVL